MLAIHQEVQQGHLFGLRELFMKHVKKIATLFNAKPENVAFTSGGNREFEFSHSIFFLIKGIS